MRSKQRDDLTAAVTQIVDRDQIFLVCSNEDNPTGLDTLSMATRQKTAEALRNASKNITRFHAILEMFNRKKEEEEAQRKKNELSIQQEKELEVQQNKAKCDEEAMKLIYWAVGRSAAISAVPLPMVDVAPLMANEAYMVFRMAHVYGYDFTKSMASAFIGMFGGSLAGKCFASWIPGVKILIACGVTCGIGYSAKAFFASGMTLTPEECKKIYEQSKKMSKEDLKRIQDNNQGSSYDPEKHE